ncbi:hypothetical protein CFOL_v3_22036 [Cephalotus follicularis]|uniref:Uncharacterized protein n=1 Tax=Cephalotus follicularis TaxID=3775 RepID=A0A1Q3CEA5_CEPFO|nr:hypothetical protein CFOL_v3_22036 [Cephalotus follicularis]
MQNYGLGNLPVFNLGRYERILSALRSIKVRLALVVVNKGAAFTTIYVEIEAGVYNYYTTVHLSHCDNEDVPRAMLCLPSDAANNPFDNVMMAIGFCQTEAVFNAVRPEGIAATNAPLRMVGIHFPSNVFGVRPAILPAGKVVGEAAGVYIVGRGNTPLFANNMARDISQDELLSVLRYRLTAP